MNTNIDNSKKQNNKKSTLVARISMFFVMAIFFVIFLLLAIFYNYDIFKNEKVKISFFIVCLIQIILVTSLMGYELINSFFYKKLLIFKILFIIALNILIYLPLYSEFEFFVGDILNKLLNLNIKEKNLKFWLAFSSILFTIILICLMISFYFLNKKENRLKDFILFTIYTLIIVFGLKSFFKLLFITGTGTNKDTSGLITLIWIWIIIILNDTFAFIGGSLFGKNKLAPTISPKKTIEGAICGVVVSVVFGFISAILLFYLKDQKYWIFNNLPSEKKAIIITLYIFISILISIIAILGDLIFSYLKRYLNKKDFSNLIPGHGGLLDRFDSLLFTMFILYILVSFM